MSKIKVVGFGFAGAVVLVALGIFVGAAPLPEFPLKSSVLPGPPGRVIFITLDGVRERDLFSTWGPLQARVRREGSFFGSRGDGESMWVSNSCARSLAGYRAIFSGKYERFCWRNDCAQIEAPTLIDELVDRGVASDDVAVFASWKQIERAIESRPRVVRSVGFETIRNLNGEHRPLTAKMEAFEKEAEGDIPPWEDARRDRYTWEMAREFERARRPRFLYVSLVDSDEYGHADDFARYRQVLLEYEKKISEFIDEVRARPDGDTVSFVITTDHGRGETVFKSHGWWIPTSTRIWAAVLPSPALRRLGVRKRSGRIYRQVDLRPTLEVLLGVPVQDHRQGDPLVELEKPRS